MAKFSYLAIDRKGKSLPGEIIASNAKEAKNKLRDDGLTPVKLKLLGGATNEKISNKILDDLAKEDEVISKVYDSYLKFKNDVSAYHEISEDAFVESRNK